MADAAHAGGEFKRELLSLIPSMRAFAMSLSGRHHLADDLVQEAMTRAWAARSSYTPMAQWVHVERVCCNLIPISLGITVF